MNIPTGTIRTANMDSAKYRPPVKAFDFFAGCGGSARGFQEAGIDIVFATDKDRDAAKTFEINFPETCLLEQPEFDGSFRGTYYLERKIEEFPTEALQPLVDTCSNHPILFAGCAPCQPFTHQNTQLPTKDDRRMLLDEFRRFVEYYCPEFVFVENVPGLQKIPDKRGAFGRLLNSLKEMDYCFVYKIIPAQHYGVPQKRSRLVLIASRLGKIGFPPKTHGRGTGHPKYSTVREWIGDLQPIKAGETHPSVPNHKAAALWSINLERIRATPEGGDRRDWPKHLQLECHSKGYRGHTDVYGRLHWDQPASCLTTRCISLSNGRFGHPEQDRAISVREAACLQTFPQNFIFYGGLGSMSRQIGNAVPVLLARHFGENFVKHLQDNLEGT